jgi:ribose transport system substrate-binding protein
MEAYKRRQAILALLRDAGEVEIDDLAQRFGVSPNSIRNDLDGLAAEGLLTRVRGGAVTLDATAALRPGGQGSASHAAFAARARVQRREKESLGRWAASLVKDGDAIILDDSSSVFQLATFLRERRNLTVVTGGLEVALLLAQNPTNRIILAANTVYSNGTSLIGALNPDLLNGFYASRLFMSAAGFSPDQGLTEIDGDVAALKTQLLRLARQVVALVDHSKVGQISTFRSAGPSQIDLLAVDAGMTSEALAELRRSTSFPIVVVGPSSVETLPPLANGVTRRYRIGFGNLTEKMVFAQQVRASLEAAASAQPAVELLIRDNRADRQTALDNAAWFVANGVDLVIEYQIDAEAGNVIMDTFQRAGIPVIAVDIPLPGATFFGADNYRAGRMAGEALGYWVRHQWSGQVDRVLKLESRRVGSLANARLQGQLEGLAAVLGPFSEKQVVAVDCPTILAEAVPAIASLLPDLPNDERIAITAINDDAALGALAAFERAGRLDQVAAVGQNADLLARAALRRPGYPFVGSTSYNPETYGERLLDLAQRLLRGEPVPPAVYVRHTFVTSQNVDQLYPEHVYA